MFTKKGIWRLVSLKIKEQWLCWERANSNNINTNIVICKRHFGKDKYFTFRWWFSCHISNYYHTRASFKVFLWELITFQFVHLCLKIWHLEYSLSFCTILVWIIICVATKDFKVKKHAPCKCILCRCKFLHSLIFETFCIV